MDPAPPSKRPNEQGPPSISGGGTASASSSSGVLQGSLGPMMSFKQFLTKQEDSISDEEAVQKYNEYKLDYKRQQLHAFFISHKDQEW